MQVQRWGTASWDEAVFDVSQPAARRQFHSHLYK